MKKFTKLIAASGAAVALCTSSYERITAKAAANISTPISLIKNEDMNFGNFAVSPHLAGTVVLTPAGRRIAGGAGGITLPSVPGTVAAADFTVSGQANYIYAITLPSSATISSRGNSMTLNAFTSSPSTNGILSAIGNQELKVGATLMVSAAQAPGYYTNSTGFMVIVNYN